MNIESHQQPPDRAPLLKVEDLHKIFRVGDQDIHAVRGVSFSIHAGEFIAIKGASGSGKSTLLGLIGGLDRPSDGRIMINGREMSTMSAAELAQFRNARLGFIFQQFNLLAGMTALENVELPLLYARVPLLERRQQAMAVLDRVGLADRAAHRPAQLSGGQQQRVAVARSLVNKPSLIIADEPTGALDSQTASALMALLTDLNDEGMTIIIVTHDDAVAATAHRQIFVKDGQIISDHVHEQS
ncbi:putative ABC transporter ATP-binding protein YvrO [alpha proteobacterium Q-1]|nr:putative ABC transporter ATP-binding protein YvrO [alpha proteobacterium Q-1]